jgi:hypothetical protein
LYEEKKGLPAFAHLQCFKPDRRIEFRLALLKFRGALQHVAIVLAEIFVRVVLPVDMVACDRPRKELHIEVRRRIQPSVKTDAPEVLKRVFVRCQSG